MWVRTAVWLSLCFCLAASECTYEEGDGTIVDCSLRILSFRRNSSDVTAVQNAKSINVVCSDVFFFESQLRSDHFGDLPDLRELSIKFCKIRQLPPRSFVSLERLSSLTVNTFNAEWTRYELEPDYEALVGLRRLEHLDLSLNNVRSLPPRLLCPLDNLKTVNLSRNGIVDLEDLGLSNRSRGDSNCTVPAEKLVLSRNEISSAPPGSLAALYRLRHLDLSFNDLGVLVENTFRGHDGLRVLNMSHNRLVALPPKIFSAIPEVQELQLSNNSIGTIDLLAFRNLSRLQVLNLSGNSLDENWIKPGIFDGLVGLVLLDLSANHISRVDSKLFADLTGLQRLSLANNQIHTVASNAFASQMNLHILQLSHNLLESLHHQTLNGLSVLNSLSLDHNRLHSLHPVALKNCTNLKKLSLSNNFLTQVQKALHHMPSLEALDLSSNVIGVVKRESLQGLPALLTLKIRHNELSRIGEGAFTETPKLRHLDVSANRLQSLEQETFRTLQELRSLNLAENQLEDINGLLQHQIELQWLNISTNRVSWFDYAFVPPSVRYLDVSNNFIVALENYYKLAENYALRYIDASSNRITSLDPMSLLPSMEDVYLEGNEISTIADNTFVGKQLLTRVHLERNNLTSLDMTALMTSPLKATPMFYFASNPFVCNCHLRWFSQINADGELLRASLASNPSSFTNHFPYVVDMDRVTCSVLHNETTVVVERPISQVAREEFLCSYEKHCLPGCMCCDFFACDCQIRCPRDGCRCFRDAEWSTNIVQCSDGGHVGVMPDGVPMDASELYLDRNNFTALQPKMLVGRARLKKLSITHSSVAAIPNQTFAGLSDLQVLHLNHNQLQHLYGYEFHGLSHLRRLHLNNNQLVSIHPDTFRRLKRLMQLRLHDNLLISYPIWELSSNPALCSLTLANNWWQCDCDFVRKFRMFIDGKPEGVVEDAKMITCTSSDGDDAGNAGGGGLKEECSGILRGFQSERTFGSDVAPLAIGVAVLCVIAMGTLFAVYKTQEAILIRLYDKYGIRLLRPKAKRESSSSEEDKVLFDALVIYSLKDEKFVADDLTKPLERSYKFCLHHRDLAGIYTSEAFKSAIAASDWQMVVLSKGLLATEWDYVKDLMLPNCMIVIKDVDAAKEEDLKTKDFIKSAKKVVTWKESNFYQKLRYYLPDPTKITTKEGGAELDVSGVWTFTSTADDAAGTANSTAASTAKLLTSPTPDASGYPHLGNPNSGGTSMLAMLQQTTASPFPAPPVKKQPHQCSTHYLSGAPSSPLTRSPLLAPATRSCGTNVVNNYHQRSSSAGVSKANSFNHARSASYAAHVATPTKRNCEGGVESPSRMRSSQQRVSAGFDAPRPSLLMQHRTGSRGILTPPVPEVQRSSSPPMSSLAMIPLRGIQHTRSSSLLDPTATGGGGGGGGGGRYAKHGHGRSASNLSPMTAVGTPRLLKSSTSVARTSSMMNGGRAGATPRAPSHHKSASNLAFGPRPQPQGASSSSVSASMLHSHQHHQSFNSLVPAVGDQHVEAFPRPTSNAPPVHFRSKSTPHEGFVL